VSKDGNEPLGLTDAVAGVRMQGRLDVVGRERQGQEAILCLSKSTPLDLCTGP
jgi:hypothetical protein